MAGVLPKRLPAREINTLLAENFKLPMEKRRTIAKMWLAGQIKVIDYWKNVPLAEKTAYRVVRTLREAEKAYEEQQMGGTVGIGPPAKHDPEHEKYDGGEPQTPDETQNDEEEVLTDQRIMDILDQNIKASSDAGETRNVKDLISVRNSIRPIREGLPVTKLDTERTLGHKGLLGMDEVLTSTLARFLTHYKEFPETWAFLCTAFDHDPKREPKLPEDVSRETEVA